MATRDEIKQAMVNRVVTEGLVGPDGQPMPAMDSVLEAVTDGIVMVEGGAPHALSHITGGTDIIPDAVPSGASGLMSGADKAKLDGIEPGAQVNQNAFSYVKVGATIIAADGKTDTLELAAGSNIALTPDAANDKVTIAVTGTVPTAQNADTVDGKHASDLALLGHGHAGGADGNPIGTSGLQDGAVTDAKVGNRTADQVQVPTGSTGTLTQLFSWLANRIKAITGMANWFDDPAATLAAIWAKFHASTGHRHTGAADDGPQIDYANIANKPGSFPPAPHASSHHSGGGDALSLDSIAGTLTDTQHGNRGGGTLHSVATASTAGFMSASDKAKLDGIQSGAEVNQNAFTSVKAVDSGGVSKGQVDADAKTDVLTLKEGTGISLAVDASTDTITIAATGGGLPAAHASTHITGGTDVIPNAVAGGASGLMSGADKQKLDGIQAGAEVNQNAFSNVLVGGTTIAADSKTDTLELVAGTNIALTPDATNDRVTIAVSGTVASASNADTVDGKHASDLVLNAGSTPSIQAGADASKPAAGTAGRLYIATDTQIIYRDSGSAWVKVGVVKWDSIDGKPSSFTPSAHKSTHASGGSDALTPGDIGAAAADHTHTNLPLTSIRPAGTNRVVVQNDYGNLTIAPANRGWCHFNTDRPKFWFDRDVAVAGEIWAGRSYNQKVWHAGNDGAGSGLDADMVDGKHASDFVLNSEKGQPNGVATLDANGKVPASQLPPIAGMEVHGNEWHDPDFETPAGAQAKVDAHANRTDNPHQVTAAQVGAVRKAGDTMTGPLQFNDTNTKILEGAGNAVRVQTNSGYVDVGPQNTGYCHYSTDRPAHWFNKEVRVAGEIYAGASYNQKVWHAGNDGEGSGLDADSLRGKRWVTVASGSVSIAGNGSPFDVPLRPGGAHHQYLISVYAAGGPVRSGSHYRRQRYWFLDYYPSGQTDRLRLLNFTTTADTFYYFVLAWE